MSSAAPSTAKPEVIIPVLAETTLTQKPTEKNTNSKTGSYGVTLGSIKGLKNSAREKLDAAGRNKEVLQMDDENLMSSWKKIVDEMTSEKIIYRNVIGQGRILFEGHTIMVYVFGVAFDFLKNQRLKLLDYFKNYYQNDEINVLVIEKAPDASQMAEQILSTREIFDKMAEKNPLLRTLKDGLGMDFDY